MSKAKSRIRNIYNLERKKEHYETPKGQSMTLPNEALSIQEILNKWTHGIDPMLTKNPAYVDEADIDDIDLEAVQRMDLTEKSLAMNEARGILDKVKEAQKNSKKEPTERKKEGEGEG